MKLSRRTSRLKKPLALRRVRGHSMEPTLKDGQLVLFSSLRRATHKSVVLAQHGGKELVKRVHIEADTLALRGDNLLDSFDLEEFSAKNIHGSLIYPHR